MRTLVLLLPFVVLFSGVSVPAAESDIHFGASGGVTTRCVVEPFDECDFDKDGDVDLADYQVFESHFTGPATSQPTSAPASQPAGG